ncbi:MAG: guanine deaminase [Pseudomonadota bacterium]
MKRQLHQGSLLHLIADPGQCEEPGKASCYEYFPDGELLVEDGHIVATGALGALINGRDTQTEVIEHPHSLLLPGFIDTHVHYPQLDVIASYGAQLLEWLERYVFPEEAKFGDPTYAEAVAKRFLTELLANGTTTALVYGTVHPESVDAFFTECEALNLRMIAGKVLMDRNAPDTLRDDPERAYAQSKELIERWHGRGRLAYAVTPRFACTSSPEQLEAAARLLAEYPDVYMQTHLSENHEEIRWVSELYPESLNYFDVYDSAGLARKRSVFAHCIHLQDAEWNRLAETQSSIAFCPSSNLFLGSGLFALNTARDHHIPVGLGSDVGAGTSLSCFHTMDAAYKTQQLQNVSLDPLENLYLATLGAAASLDLHDKIGNFSAGKEADFVVLDLNATPQIAERLKRTQTISETLFALITLGDDRVVGETWSFGKRCYVRR